MRKNFLVLALLPFLSSANAEELIRYKFQTPTNQEGEVEAVMRVPATSSMQRAVVILHHAGGWGKGTTKQHAEYLNAAGFVTLEPRLFNSHPRNPLLYMRQVFGALNFLAQHPAVDKSQISIMGLSFGANLSIFAATKWAKETFSSQGLQFRAHAAFYPNCWRHTAAIKRELPERLKVPNLRDDFEDQWLSVPMRIFSGTEDDYDSRDSNACKSFIDAIPDERQKNLTTNIQYQGATHGWDQETATFFEPIACKGKGCINHNVNNPEVTSRAKKDLLQFLNESLNN